MNYFAFLTHLHEDVHLVMDYFFMTAVLPCRGDILIGHIPLFLHYESFLTISVSCNIFFYGIHLNIIFINFKKENRFKNCLQL